MALPRSSGSPLGTRFTVTPVSGAKARTAPKYSNARARKYMFAEGVREWCCARVLSTMVHTCDYDTHTHTVVSQLGLAYVGYGCRGPGRSAYSELAFD